MIDEKTPVETWNDLKKNENAILIDVRALQEWEEIGYPDLSSINKKVIKISIQNELEKENIHFISELKLANIQPTQTLYFICRSGKRSLFAAELAQQAGFYHVVSVADGFEGPADENDRRGYLAGWLAEKLPAIFSH